MTQRTFLTIDRLEAVLTHASRLIILIAAALIALGVVLLGGTVSVPGVVANGYAVGSVLFLTVLFVTVLALASWRPRGRQPRLG